MGLIVIGLNHRSAPVELRERLAISPAQLLGLLPDLNAKLGTTGLVLLSTCNRMEMYLSAADIPATKKKAFDFIKAHAQSDIVESQIYAREEADAIHHLFRVAGGLDSLVVGENEILSQVKQAYHAAHSAGCTDTWINVLFQRSLYIGKRVRTETGLSQGSASVASVAVALAERIFEDLHLRDVMILGAGKMAELTAKYLLSQKVRSILVANRTYERACELAQQFNGRAIHFEEAITEMEHTDIIICSTAAPHPVILADQVRQIMQRRKGRSLFFIDIAMPRDVHPDVHRLDNVYVYHMDDLQSIVAENTARRFGEISQAEAIIQEKSREFIQWLADRRTGHHHGFKHGSNDPHRNILPTETDSEYDL